MLIFYKIICLIIGYCFGLFQTGYIYGKINNIDIRDFGSGNAGTTNAMRVLGKKAGIITYIGDMLKGVLAGLTIRIIFGIIFDISKYGDSYSIIYILVLYTGLGVVLGHNYPFYMNFKGGKGIAASSGVILSLFNLPLALLSMFTFIVVTYISKYVSLGSIVMMIMYFFSIIFMVSTGNINIIGNDNKIEIFLLTFIFSGLAIFKHRGNIVRLINGTERKIGQKKLKTEME